MNLEYQEFALRLNFSEPVFPAQFPPFVLRSVLGKELHHLGCIFKNRQCQDCDLKFQCVYSRIFARSSII